MTRTVEWLKWRRGGIGASDIATIAGLNPWKGRWTLWSEKVGDIPEPDESEAMEFGRRAEDMISGYFTDRTGLFVAGEQTWCSHPEHGHHICTVDGFVVEGANSAIEDAVGLVEMKTTSAEPFSPEGESEVLDMYRCQAQWQMHVTGLDRCWLAVLHGPRFRLYEVERDEADIAALVAVGDEFWQQVVDLTPPEPDHRDLDAVMARWPETEADKVYELDSEHLQLLQEIANARAAAKAAETAEKSARAQLGALVGDAEILTFAGAKVGTWKSHEKRGLDKAALLKAHPELNAEYETTSTVRTLRINKEVAA